MSEVRTALRFLDMLSLIPALPRKVTARNLTARLVERGHAIGKRSVERDLNKLSAQFPLISDDARPAGWSWKGRETRFSLPPMDTSAALTLELVSRYLTPVLPANLRAHLEPDIRQAQHTLALFAGEQISKWSRKIAVLPQGQALLPPKIQSGVSEVVYEALLAERQFKAEYKSLESNSFRSYVFNPLGLVYRQGVLYLVATLFGYDEVLQFTLHRMKNATLLEERVQPHKGFDLARYVEEEKGFDIPTGKKLTLVIDVEPWLARILDESRLADDQVIKPIGNSERLRVTATVAETDQLFWWLRSFGPAVEVRKPVALRRRLAGEARILAEMYG